MIRRGLALLSLVSAPLWANEPAPELKLLSEHPVQGMSGGNLSGMAWCGDALWAVSDREDDVLYRLDTSVSPWQAEPERFEAGPPPDSGLPWGMRMRAWLSGHVRGGHLDFEGLSCDALGNRYVVSEAHAAVLQVSPAGTAEWLRLPESLVRQARASGMLWHFNALFEGIAVDPKAERMWLAAERERRGLLVMHRKQSSWQCTGGCVLMAQGGHQQPRGARRYAAAAQLLGPGLFQRQAVRAGALCISGLPAQPGERDGRTLLVVRRRGADRGARYREPFGNAEALWIDAEGAWIGVDNNGKARGDGEKRPIVWRFAAPSGGWMARP